MEQDTTRPRRRKLIRVWLCGAAAIVVLAVMGFIGWNMLGPGGQQGQKIPQRLVDTIPFAVYYIDGLPNGSRVDQTSYKYADGVLSFTVRSASGKAVLVTQQFSPATFDVEAFTTSLHDPKAVITPYGKAVTGKNQRAQVATLTSGRTWIFMSSDQGSKTDDLEMLLSHLKLQK